MSRWYRSEFRVQLDYVRHTNGDLLENPAVGGLNIAYADGHVAWRQNTDLYDPQTKKSTYDTLWSPIDRSVDEKGDN